MAWMAKRNHAIHVRYVTLDDALFMAATILVGIEVTNVEPAHS
jgi:hypothetical protein